MNNAESASETGGRVGLRVLALLQRLANEPAGLGAQDLAEAAGVHPTTIYRALQWLASARYVEKAEDSTFRVGIKLIELASAVLQQRPVSEIAHKFLVSLSHATQKTVHLCVLHGRDIVYLDKVEGQATLPLLSRIGNRAPAYCTATGKVLLAAMPRPDVRELLRGHRLVRHTASTITSLKELLSEIDEVAQQGYAVDRAEHEEGVYCLAAPIRRCGGDAVAAISTTGLRRELEEPDERTRVLGCLLQTAAGISHQLGYIVSEPTAVELGRRRRGDPAPVPRAEEVNSRGAS